MSSSLLLLGSVLTAAVAAQEPSTNPDAARVEVYRGRALVVDEGGERTLAQGDEHLGQGRSHLELGAGAEAGISWPGRASLHVWGPAALEWSEPPQGRGDERQSFSTRDLQVELFDLAWADLEVRRGRHVLRLPGGWRGHFDAGAFYLRGLPTGPTELRHHAGSPISLEWAGDPDRARPPVTIYPGSSLLLAREPDEAPRTERRVGSAHAQEWRDTEWPWTSEERVPSGLGVPSAPGAPERGALARVPEFGTAPRVRVEVHPFGTADPEDPAPPAVEPAPVEEPAPAPAPPAEEPAPVVQDPVVDLDFHPEHWRGLPRAKLVGAGAVAVERAAGVDVRVFPSGRRKVFLDASAPAPAWCFAPGVDLWMHPGSVAVFEPDGTLRTRLGTIDEHAAAAGRPAYELLAE